MMFCFENQFLRNIISILWFYSYCSEWQQFRIIPIGFEPLYWKFILQLPPLEPRSGHHKMTILLVYKMIITLLLFIIYIFKLRIYTFIHVSV